MSRLSILFLSHTQTEYMDILKEIKKIQKDLVGWRRYLHAHAEVGFEMEKTTAFLQAELEKMGYAPQKCGRAGLVVTIGEGENVFLLRADMDGLPIQEKTGSAFACKSGHMHACGHDMHAAMLLGAAKLLKQIEGGLTGKIRLLFQPAEETLEGAKDVIEAGVLENVSGAMMLHVLTSVPLKTGTLVVARGTSAPAADYFTIGIKGVSCHGSTPWEGVDSVTIGARILLALEELSARELVPATPFVLTVGSFQGGTTGNVLSDFAKLEGTLRCFDEGTRKRIKKRMGEVVQGIAKSFLGKAKLRFTSGCPTLVNNESLSKFVEEEGKNLFGENLVFNSQTLGGETQNRSGGSEDFSYISHKVPSIMVGLAAGEKGKGYTYPLHHPKTQFDENALGVGVALFVGVAKKFSDWKNHQGN